MDIERATKRRKRDDTVPSSQTSRGSQMSQHSSGPTTSQNTPRPRQKAVPTAMQHHDVVAVLDRSVGHILQSHGFTGATKLAQTDLVRLAGEYMGSLTRTIGILAQSQRRVVPSVTDFEQCFIQHGISISSLNENRKRTRRQASKPVLTVPVEESKTENNIDTTALRELFGPELDGSSDKRDYVWDSLPPFPSKHTYLITPVYAERPSDPQILREMATKDAMLAENALRNLLAAEAASQKKTKGEREEEAQMAPKVNGIYSGHKSVTAGSALKNDINLKRKRRDSAWQNAFEKLNAAEEEKKKNEAGGSGEHTFGGNARKKKYASSDVWLDVSVNHDSKYWATNNGDGI